MRGINLNVAMSPHIRLVHSSRKTFWFVSVCLMAPILQAAINSGPWVLWLPFATVAGAVLAELFFDALYGELTADDGSAVVTGLVLALLLPARFNPGFAVLGGAFAVAVIKRCFGGLGSNWMNPAIAAYLFLLLSWPDSFSVALSGSSASILKDGLAKGLSDPSGSPLAILKILGHKASGWDTALTLALNDSLFSRIGAELPAGYLGLLARGTDASMVADQGLGALVIASIALLAFEAVRFRTSFAFLLSFSFCVRLLGGLPFGGDLWTGDVAYALCDGGIVLTAFVLLADPATSGRTFIGKTGLAAIAGALAFLFTSAGTGSAILAVAVVNMVSPLVRAAEGFLFTIPRRPK